jgi:hypothetical protein
VSLRRDRARPRHICTGTGLARRHICTGTGLAPATSALGLGSPAATSAPGLGSPLPHLQTALTPATSAPGLHWDWAHPCHICTGTACISVCLSTCRFAAGPSLRSSRPSFGPAVRMRLCRRYIALTCALRFVLSSDVPNHDSWRYGPALVPCRMVCALCADVCVRACACACACVCVCARACMRVCSRVCAALQCVLRALGAARRIDHSRLSPVLYGACSMLHVCMLYVDVRFA